MNTIFMTYTNAHGDTIHHEVPNNVHDHHNTREHMEQQGYVETHATLTQPCGHHFTTPECEEDILAGLNCKHTYGHCPHCI